MIVCKNAFETGSRKTDACNSNLKQIDLNKRQALEVSDIKTLRENCPKVALFVKSRLH